jgi:hypothetical protein
MRGPSHRGLAPRHHFNAARIGNAAREGSDGAMTVAWYTARVQRIHAQSKPRTESDCAGFLSQNGVSDYGRAS